MYKFIQWQFVEGIKIFYIRGKASGCLRAGARAGCTLLFMSSVRGRDNAESWQQRAAGSRDTGPYTFAPRHINTRGPRHTAQRITVFSRCQTWT